jgi:hypothetical protein
MRKIRAHLLAPGGPQIPLRQATDQNFFAIPLIASATGLPPTKAAEMETAIGPPAPASEQTPTAAVNSAILNVLSQIFLWFSVQNDCTPSANVVTVSTALASLISPLLSLATASLICSSYAFRRLYSNNSAFCSAIPSTEFGSCKLRMSNFSSINDSRTAMAS